MDVTIQTIPKLLYKQFFEKNNRKPVSPLPILPFKKQTFLNESKMATFIWYGHSVVLMQLNGKVILIDPMLGENAAPIAPFAIKRFSKNTLNLIDDFPEIDLVLLTHDHYDHLDLASIEKLKPKVKQFYVALGVARHLTAWGIKNELIEEFNWWDRKKFADITITFTPTRHFSGRGLTDRAKSLWGGWALQTSFESIWFSGDGGYGKHFKEIGSQLGPFDFAFMECGQYNKYWHQIHLFPEESVQAAIDANVKRAIPVHWAGFSLAMHAWFEPVERFEAEAKKLNLSTIYPKLGEQFTAISNEEDKEWWETYLES